MDKFLFLLIVLAGCSKQIAKPEASFLALGDSYTIGEAVDEEGRWPNQLASRMKTSNINVQICLLYTSPSPRDATLSRMPSSA